MARRKTIQRDPFGRVASEYEEENEEQASYDSNGLLKDGHRVRVPLYMRDGAINPDLTPTQCGKAAHQTQVQVQAQDAAARRFGLSDGLQLHKPGFRYNTWDAAAQERTRQAYNDADAEAVNAWRGNASVKPSANTSESQVGEPRDAADARAEAYRLYDEEMQNAWRGGK